MKTTFYSLSLMAVLFIGCCSAGCQLSDDKKAMSAPQASEGVRHLFDLNKRLSLFCQPALVIQDKEQVLALSNLVFNADSNAFFLETDKAKEWPVTCGVRVIDINGDGFPEIFLSLFNLDYFGQAGQEIIYSKQKDGRINKLLAVEGRIEFLMSRTGGYPDLLIGGPGYTAPVYRWKGTRYTFGETVSFTETNSPKTYDFDDFCAANVID